MPRMKLVFKGRKVGGEEVAPEGRKVGSPVQIVDEQDVVLAEGDLAVDVMNLPDGDFELPVKFYGRKVG